MKTPPFADFGFSHPLSLLVLLLTLTVGLGDAALAQSLANPTPAATTSPIALDDPQSKEAVRDLVATLSDDAVRALLIARLDAVAQAKTEAEQSKAGAFDILRDGFVGLWNYAGQSVLNIGTIPNTLTTVGMLASQALESDGRVHLSFIILAALIAGLVAERCVAFVFHRKKQKLIEAVSSTLWGILKILYTRLSFDVLGVLAFAAAAYTVVASIYGQNIVATHIAAIVIAPMLATGMAYVISRFYFAPRRPDLRICKTTDARAMRLTISYSVLAGYIVFIHNCFYTLLGVGVENFGGWERMGPLAFFLNISMYIAAAGVLWYNRRGLSEVLMENKKRVYLAIGDAAPEDLSWFATHWPKIAVLLLVLKYLLVEIVINSTDVGVYSTSAVYITLIVIFLWPGVDATVSLWVARGVRTPDDESNAAGKARRGMQQGLLRVGRVFVVCVVLYALASLWGLNVLSLAEAGLGAKAAGRLVEVMFIALIAYIIWELISVFVGRWLASEGGLPEDESE
jgi:hypothetical protein